LIICRKVDVAVGAIVVAALGEFNFSGEGYPFLFYLLPKVKVGELELF